MSGVVEEFLSQYVTSTSRIYRGVLAEFEQLTGSPVEQATQRDVLRYQAAQDGLKPATVGRKLATLSALYHYLRDRGIRSDNPMAGIRLALYKVDKAATVKYLDHDQIRALMAAAQDAREAALIVVLLHGLRISEALGLNVEQVRGGSLVGILGKGGTVRTIPLRATAQRILADYIGHRRSGALFLSRSRRRLSVSRAADLIYAASERAGKRASPHRLRHSFATTALRSGVGLAHLQDMMGHASPVTTRVYAKLTGEDYREAIDSADLLGENESEGTGGVSNHPLGQTPPVPLPVYPTVEPLRVIEGGRRGR